MQKFNKQITIILACVMLLFSVALVACDGTPQFEYVTAPGAGSVTSNGGVAVGYGDYIYYVNGHASDVNAVNKYNGDAKQGDIVRISKADFEAVVALNDDDTIASGDLAETISKSVASKVEIVVPMFYYTGNTTNTSVNGLFIYGNKLYFTTPNPDLTAGGNSQTNQLSIYNADLDGRNVTKLYTVEVNTAVVMLAEVDNVVYALYDNTDLFAVNLSTLEETKVAEKVTSTNYNLAQKSVYYINSDKDICQYTAGDSEATVLVDNTDSDHITYTIVSNNGGYVYYTVADSSVSGIESSAIWAVKSDVEAKIIAIATPTNSYLCYGEGVIITGATYASTPTMIQLYYTTDSTFAIKDYIIPLNTNKDTITLNSIVGDVLTYTINSKEYTVNMNVDQGGYQPVHVHNSMSAAGWSYVDTLDVNGKTYYFMFSSTYDITASIYDATEDKTTTTTLTRVVIEEE